MRLKASLDTRSPHSFRNSYRALTIVAITDRLTRKLVNLYFICQDLSEERIHENLNNVQTNLSSGMRPMPHCEVQHLFKDMFYSACKCLSVDSSCSVPSLSVSLPEFFLTFIMLALRGYLGVDPALLFFQT